MQKKSRRKFLVLLSAMLAVSLCGCASAPMTNSAQGKRLYMAKDSRFDDVPYPAGFKLLGKDTFIFQNDNTRIGSIRYEGRAKVSDIINFYKDGMPLYNWNLLNVVEHGMRFLNFDKAAESCIISVEERPFGKAIITASLTPKSSSPLNKKVEAEEDTEGSKKYSSY